METICFFLGLIAGTGMFFGMSYLARMANKNEYETRFAQMMKKKENEND